MTDTATVDYKRQKPIFDPFNWRMSTTIVGCGGVGSHVGQHLANFGVGLNPDAKVLIYDHDHIEAHNPPNQAFLPRQVGMLKVAAMSELYRAQCGVSIEANAVKIRGKIDLSGVVFLCLDSMRDRKLILEECVWGNPNIKLVIETRMDAYLAKVFTMDPNNPAHHRIWNKWFGYSDSETENIGSCDGHLSIGTKTDMTAILAVEQFLAFASCGSVEPLANQLEFMTNPWTFRARYWSKLQLDDGE